MKMPHTVFLSLAASALLLVGCGEKPQVMGGVKHGAASYEGVSGSGFAQSGWTAGDRNSWEQHLKTRAQYGQNDFSRMGE